MKKLWILCSMMLALGLWGCQKPLDEPKKEEEQQQQQQQQQQEQQQSKEDLEKKNTYLYVNTFARNTMNLYYLWNKEIKTALDSWEDTEEPIAKVADIRYHTGSGKNRVDIDRWTSLYDDFSAFYGSVTGNQKTYGFDFTLYGYDEKTICAVVTFTYPDSPAAKAGLRRGDVITKVNGKTMKRDSKDSSKISQDAIDIIYNELLDGDKVDLTFLRLAEVDGKQGYVTSECSMNSKEMYEDPVILSKVFDCGGKKVGYLVFTSFTLEACKDLIRVAKEFKAEGIQELILDLRYNGGGFVYTEEVLASLLVPEAEIEARSILSTEVYNEGLTEFYATYNEKLTEEQILKGMTRGVSYFTTEHYLYPNTDDETVISTAGANIGITKLYAIIESGTASASEAVLCDLYPYLDIVLVGQQSHGKYCSGSLMEGPDFFDDYADQLGANVVKKGKQYTENWGLYVMFSRFADKDGVTRCMPDGFTPDYEVEDDPLDGCQLGDAQETMLAEALKLAGYTAKAPAARRTMVERLPIDRIPGIDPFRPEFGMRIFLHK